MANLREQVDMTDPIRVLVVRARLLGRPRVDGRHHARPAVLAYRPVAYSPAALTAAADLGLGPDVHAVGAEGVR